MKYLLLNLPNPRKIIHKGYAGGFGTLGHSSRKPLLPIYLLYGASAIEKAECIYKVLDAQALKYSYSDVLNFIRKESPDILILWISMVSVNDDLKMLAKIKKENARVCIVAIGTILNIFPEKALFNGADIVIKGTYPYYNHILNMVRIFNKGSTNQNTFAMINGGTYINNGKIVGNNSILKENLDELDFQIYSQLPIDKYIDYFEDINGTAIDCIPIVTSVGCTYSCIYCPYPIGYGKKIINKSIENIITEIEFLKDNFGIKGFMFRDQLFSYDLERIKILCDELIRKDLKIKWFVEARADNMPKDVILKMREAGCFRIHYGIETGDPKILEKIGKPGLNTKKIKKTFEIMKDLHILSQAHYIIGLPGETRLTLKNSLKFLYILNPDAVNISIITPYPGTKLYELAKEKNWILNFNLEDYTGFNAVMRTDSLDIKQLNFARQEMNFKFIIFKCLKDKNYAKILFKHFGRKILKRFHILALNGRPNNLIKYIDLETNNH